MTTAEHPSCAGCPLRGDHEIIPDALVRLAPVLVLQDRVGDPPVPQEALTAAKLAQGQNVSFGHALRCEAAKRVRSGKRYEAALTACRRHDDWTGIQKIVACGPVAWQALGHTEWSVSRGYPREVGAA